MHVHCLVEVAVRCVWGISCLLALFVPCQAPASPESEGEAEPTAAQADPEDLGDGHVTKLKVLLSIPAT